MSDSLPHSALREWWAHMRQPTTVIVLLGIGVVTGLAAPFQTAEAMALVPRIAYWIVTCAACYSVGFAMNAGLAPLLRQRAVWVQIAICGTLIGLVVTCVVTTINYLALDFFPRAEAWPEFLGSILAVSIVINGILTFVDSSSPQDLETTATTPALLDRLPFDKRGPLVALSVEDHYVRVQTSKGEDLILMRLSDAIKEVGTTHGAQVHRSHWAAFDQVTSVRREGDRAILTMKNDTEIPVSRANLSKIKEAGLLPR